MANGLFLGLDLGTGSVKALLMDGVGTVLGEGSVSYQVHSPRPGWAESDPEEWWRACAAAVRTATTSSLAAGEGREVVALGLSGQMHGVVLSDAAGRSLRPAVLWADARSEGLLDAYRALGEGLLERLANPPAVGMAGPSLLWLRDNEPDLYGAAVRALQPKDWVRLRLTGEALSEPSDASATLLYDLLLLPPGSDGWSDAVVEALGLRRDLLAPLVPSGSVAGELSCEAAGRLGLPEGLPVAAGAADAAAAALGSGVLTPGVVQLSVGTGGQILAPRDSPVPDPHGRTHLYRSAIDGPADSSGRFYAMAAVHNEGLALVWVRRLLKVSSWRAFYDEAFAAPPGSEGALFLPYLSGERTPHFDAKARGAWVDLSLSHGRPHLLRAALEGVAYSLREALEALETAGVAAPELRLAGGGTLREPWRGMLADVLGRPLLILPDSVAQNASARGAALLAGIAVGAYASAADTAALAPGPERVVRPEAPEAYEEPYARYRGLHGRLRG